MRKCKLCNYEGPDEDFYVTGGYSTNTCKPCWLVNNRARTAAYYAANRDSRMASMKRRYEDHKKKVFAHYGDACSCCGERQPLFLTIDHIDNDGSAHRKMPGRSSHNNIYGWLVRKGMPAGFQVLCMNCNQGKHRNGGICPHQDGSTTRA